MARKFLYLVAILTFLVIAGAFALRVFGDDLSRAAFVPSVDYEEQKELAANIYANARMWYARPDIAQDDNPVLWLPEGVGASESDAAAIFFVHPTSYMQRDHWNASLGDAETEKRARTFLRGQASAFNHVGEIWAPKYRQATIGAFLTDKPEAGQALDAAYRDVALAFDQFLQTVPPDRPILLAGHSQGALHLTRLLQDQVAEDEKLSERIVAAYIVGWPVSITADLPALGLPACDTPEATGCVLSWQSFAEPADFGMITYAYDRTDGLTGKPRKGTPLLCTNPLTGTVEADAPVAKNLGTMVPNDDLTEARLVKGAVPARCGKEGFLMIGDPPDLGPYVLPGNNYHVYDFSLFWTNIRADAQRRLAAFLKS